MPTATVNGVRLFYELSGETGPPLVLIHGAWGDHTSWDPVVPALAQRFRVLTYDRRGHSQSERPGSGGGRETDAADLAALIEHLGLAPAHIAGISSGAIIGLRLALRRPDVVRGVAAHEPPLFRLLIDDPTHGATMRDVLGAIDAVVTRLEAGEMEEGTRQFMETIAFGEGAWDTIPSERRPLLIGNAAPFAVGARDPRNYTIDLAALAACPRPILLTDGDQSPACFPPVVTHLADLLPAAEMRTFADAGHVPVNDHPDEYAAAITAFAEAVDAEGRC